ncbi:MAG: AAA family ATPase [Desulfobulbaceae bacterium]|nr:AAA family ATPase [Desulfobulbaceae bacterium]
MRLIQVQISEYKNLKDFELHFDGNSFIDVFVGKNGTGKSNLFEALLEIFRHLYATDEKSRSEIGFDYLIEYEINGKIVKIEWADNKFTVNGEKNRKNPGSKTPLPDNVLIYYSGHNVKVHDLVHEYEDSFKKTIKKAGVADTRRFIGIGKEYKQLLLSVLLLQKESNGTRKVICNRLGIKSVATEVKLTLKRPFYADSKAFDIELNDETDRYWKSQGITKIFLERLVNCKLDDSKGPVRTEGYLSKEDRYIHYLDADKVRKEFSELSAQELFRQFDNLKIIEMLSEITIPVTLENGQEATTNFFSDGQFQLVYIYSIIELFKDLNCLTLLDEPDAFLHPAWQFDFLKQVFEITDAAAKNNHVLMSSHSAVTLIPHDNKKIKFFDIKKHNVNCYDLPKQIAINKLSSDLIHYSEQNQLLSIINTIQIEKKPVLFTEGSTDPIILKEAWHKLFEEEMPFIPFYAFSCTYISQLLTDNRIGAEMGGLPIFALFDFDMAFNQWKGLDGTVIEGDPFKGMVKKWASGESYAIMLPVPLNPDIQKQVIKNSRSKETFGGGSCCEIEHIFYGDPSTEEYFQEECCVGGKKIVFKSDADKTSFAKEIVHALDKSFFETFRPMFEFIKGKCSVKSSKVGSVKKVVAKAGKKQVKAA